MWYGELNITQIREKERKQEDVFCSLQFSSDVLGWEGLSGLGMQVEIQSLSLPTDTAFWIFSPNKLSLTPTEMGSGEL